MRELTIGTHRIADDTPAYVVAEIGHNHGGSFSTACALIREMAAAGVDAVKFQVRTNETLYSPSMLAAPYTGPASYGPTYGAHRSALELPPDALTLCRDRARTVGVEWFATGFDEVAIDRLMALGVKALKIHSGGCVDPPLLRHAAAQGVPVLLSTGGATEREISKAADLLARGAGGFALLHCTAAYPIFDYREVNLRCIETLREHYPEVVVGWSGHTAGIAMATAAVAFGARVIEQHVTLNRGMRGTDHGWSLEPVGVRKLVRDVHRLHEALGDGQKRRYPSEDGPLAKMTRRRLLDGSWAIGTRDEWAA